MQPTKAPRYPAKMVLEAEVKWTRLLRYLQDLEATLVQQIRLGDPLKASNDSLLRFVQGQLNLLSQIDSYIATLEDGTEHVDPNFVQSTIFETD